MIFLFIFLDGIISWKSDCLNKSNNYFEGCQSQIIQCELFDTTFLQCRTENQTNKGLNTNVSVVFFSCIDNVENDITDDSTLLSLSGVSFST